MFDLNNLMGKAREMQEKIKEAQANLNNIKTTAEAGAGMVKATVNGNKQVLSIDVDSDIMKTDDKEMMQDLIVAAINKALTDIESISKEEMQKATEGIMPNMPFDLGNMGNIS